MPHWVIRTGRLFPGGDRCLVLYNGREYWRSASGWIGAFIEMVVTIVGVGVSPPVANPDRVDRDRIFPVDNSKAVIPRG